VYNENPSAADRGLWIGDCSPFLGQCDGHPLGHKGKSADVNYYATPTNATQYRDHGEAVQIWENGELNANFNSQMSYDFAKYVTGFGLTYRTHDKIKKLFRDKFGDVTSIQSDTGYNHGTHAHIEG
jgi:hypothetical protein